MDSAPVIRMIGKGSEAPNYRGATGEQDFYAALTLNLDWFEREMAKVRAVLRPAVAVERTPRQAPRPAH